MTNAKKTKKISTKIKKKSTEIQKPFSKQEVKERLGRVDFYDEHPDRIYKRIWELLHKDLKDWSDEEQDYLQTHVRSLDNFTRSHIWLAETQKKWHLRTTIVELANNLIEEYECETTLEKTLCEVIANSYGKVMSISRKLDSSLSFEYFWHERNGFISIMSKELDRANRSYLSAMNQLIEIKEPKTSINIKTKNAYIAQNQQINTNQDANAENIKD